MAKTGTRKTTTEPTGFFVSLSVGQTLALFC